MIVNCGSLVHLPHESIPVAFIHVVVEVYLRPKLTGSTNFLFDVTIGFFEFFECVECVECCEVEHCKVVFCCEYDDGIDDEADLFVGDS